MSERPTLEPCPDCDGATILDGKRCSFCGGHGAVTAERASWKQRGDDVRVMRESVSQNYADVSFATGLSKKRIALIEAGMEDPEPLERHYLRKSA